ncbi:RNA-guided pseudouridylation complex pseudouridine synthase subunit Cbf5 [Candidatus Nanohalococcus occultus]|uniref:Pseudouridine synthase n=1 Tax=Candidatus Nanohalococcus occultus TaxID=2978047 RepID=A0ABY8CFD1_9ARCH|nr:Pseudouridine synthase [Candidatus Nanohaloarchaeota archaeon SVXNc]
MVEWYTREESEPSEEFGTVPSQRNVEQLLEKSFIVIDKPFGPTSNQVSSWIKKELNLHKTGHFGTLDPNATGVLPVGINGGTRIQRVLSQSEKEYIFEAELTQDRAEEDIEDVLKQFLGENQQTPPEKSAVKKEERSREVYEIELLEKDGKKILGRVRCESGFYVRVLIEQIGDELDVAADMNELRRTKQGFLSEEDTCKIQDIVDAYHFYKGDGDEEKIRELVHPIENAVKDIPKVVVKDSAVNAVANGSKLGTAGISKLQDGISEGDMIAVMTLKGELICIADALMSSEEMFSEDGDAAAPETVHMKPEEYPKRWDQ